MAGIPPAPSRPRPGCGVRGYSTSPAGDYAASPGREPWVSGSGSEVVRPGVVRCGGGRGGQAGQGDQGYQAGQAGQGGEGGGGVRGRGRPPRPPGGRPGRSGSGP